MRYPDIISGDKVGFRWPVGYWTAFLSVKNLRENEQPYNSVHKEQNLFYPEHMSKDAETIRLLA